MSMDGGEEEKGRRLEEGWKHLDTEAKVPS